MNANHQPPVVGTKKTAGLVQLPDILLGLLD
jgi:hypothetical protein